MWDRAKIIQYIKENLKESRYVHTLGVADYAVKLAEINGVDKDKAEIAALIHDAAKYMDINDQMDILNRNGYIVDDVMKHTPQILHGPVSAFLAKELMGINDEDIFNAVMYHSTGRKNMTTLEKIIYIADYIEPNRDFPGVEEIRKETFENLDKGLLLGMSNSIIYVIKNGSMVHPLTIESRNYILSQVNA